MNVASMSSSFARFTRIYASSSFYMTKTSLLRPCTSHPLAFKRTFQSSTTLASSHPADRPSSARPKTTINHIRKLYKQGEPITVMTAHDYPSGLAVDRAEMDICLVGDSLAMVALGYDTTNPVTMDEMLHHSRAVARGNKSSFLIADLPYGSYESSIELAVQNSVRYIKEGGMEAVKLEGGVEMVDTIRKIKQVGIPVMGHIGLTPQRQSALGGYRVQGKTTSKALQLLKDALAVQEAGAFIIVLEAVPEPVATYITKRLKVPTIGIGAGVGCSGQVLVFNDCLGVFDKFVPRFCKQYAHIGDATHDALVKYRDEVKSRSFPSEQYCYPMATGESEKFLATAESIGISEDRGKEQ